VSTDWQNLKEWGVFTLIALLFLTPPFGWAILLVVWGVDRLRHPDAYRRLVHYGGRPWTTPEAELLRSIARQEPWPLVAPVPGPEPTTCAYEFTEDTAVYPSEAETVEGWPVPPHLRGQR